MSARRVIHTITPGDHFSPRTGSAIPTVVNGFASAAMVSGDSRHAIAIARSSYTPRYDSAEPIEYDLAPQPRKHERFLDIVAGRLGGERAATAAYYRPIADALRSQPPATVLAHNAALLPWLLRDTEHRVVLYAHNELLRTYSRSEAVRALEPAAAIVCVSDSLAAATASRLPRRLHERIRVVRNGADTVRFAPAPERPSGGRVRVSFIGRVIADKGPDVLVQAARLVRHPALEFAVVGSSGFARDAAPSDYERRLRRLAAAAAAPVRFEPFVDRDALPGFMQDTEILVIPSRWPDPCPLTVGEGLAAGLPIVASRIGGIPEIVAPSTRLIAADDPAALAVELDALAADPRLRDRLGDEARAWAEAHDWRWAWSELRSVLDDI